MFWLINPFKKFVKMQNKSQRQNAAMKVKLWTDTFLINEKIENAVSNGNYTKHPADICQIR